MTQVLSPSDEDVQDFSEHIDVKFRIDGDTFVGVSNIPASDLLEFGRLFTGMTESDVIQDPKAFTTLFNLVLTTESATRFLERMSSKTEPISMTQIMRIMPWIMGEYGMRPTEPSSNSSNGSPNQDDGTSSMVSVSPSALTSGVSQPIAS
jgi:hypothetical protein